MFAHIVKPNDLRLDFVKLPYIGFVFLFFLFYERLK